MASVFTPEHSPLDRIFAQGTTYIIPPYQRPYSWQALGKSDKDNQVIQLWDDLWRFFRATPDGNKEYFLGSMVICEDPAKLRVAEVIDGQQRLTTLLLLFAAMRCFLASVGSPDAEVSAWLPRARAKLTEKIYNEVGLGLSPELKVRIVRAIQPDFGAILESAIQCQDCDGNQTIGGLQRKHREIALRYFKNRDYLIERLKQHFLFDGALSKKAAAEFDKFFSFLQQRVAIVLIKTTDIETAYGIFEILNNRGLALSNLDLLRNFVISGLSTAKIGNPEAEWERLEKEYTLSEDFVSRWTESINAAQPQMSSFSDIKVFYESERYADGPGRPRAVSFYKDLEQNLRWYTLLFEEEPDSWQDSRLLHAVQLIKGLGNVRYSMDLMLALLRSCRYAGGSNDAMLSVLRNYLRYALFIELVPTSGKFDSKRVYDAIRELNSGRLDLAQQRFALVDAEKQSLVSALDGPIKDNKLALSLIAAYFWHLEETEPADVVTQKLDYERSTLEHIMPQNPAQDTNWLKEFSEEFRARYTYRLGNMTLLTRSRNSANRNFDYSIKREIYRKAKLPTTVKLAEQTKLTETYIEQRHRELVANLYQYFDLT